MNKVTLAGRLTRDPEITYSNSGAGVSRFSIAVDRRFKKDGDANADFINIVAFGKTGEFVEKWFKKGSGIVLSGRIQTGSYTNKDGKKVYTTDVIAEEVEFPQGGKSAGGQTKTETSTDDGFMLIPDDADGDMLF